MYGAEAELKSPTLTFSDHILFISEANFQRSRSKRCQRIIHNASSKIQELTLNIRPYDDKYYSHQSPLTAQISAVCSLT